MRSQGIAPLGRVDTAPSQQTVTPLQPSSAGTGFKVRLIPIGGVTDVTKNMYVYELYKDNVLADIIIVDCGIGFPREKDLGVDLVIPDVSYLKDKTDKIRAVLLTHGHEDHISALSYHYKSLGSPPVYSGKLTAHFVEHKFIEAGLTLRVNRIDYLKTYQFGAFEARFIQLTHSIPDTTHIFIRTPVGNFYHGSDFKFDLTPPYGNPPDFYAITQAGSQGVLCLLSDCLGSEREGSTLSESAIGQTFEDHIRTAKGKFIMTTFSSNISRIRQCVEAAVKFNRKVCFLGRSMKQNTEVAADIGYLPIPKKFIVAEEKTKHIPANQLCLIVAGSQGQYGSALSKIASGNHRFIHISKGDKVLFSSDPIPGNEDAVNDVIEYLYVKGAEVIYPSIEEQLHASGHGNQEELKLLMRLTKPKYLFPIGGTVRHQRQYARLAKDLGFTDDKIFLLADSDTIVFEKQRAYLGDRVETKQIYVDAYGVGDVGNVILRDRETLGKEGIVFVVLATSGDMRLVRSPEFISRGFVYERDEVEMFAKAAKTVESIIAGKKGQATTANVNLEKEIISSLEQYFKKETGRFPLVCVQMVTV